MGWKSKWISALVALGLVTAAQAETPLAARTIVVYNSLDPSSKSLAQFYAEKRAIPADNLMGLALPAEEEIARDVFNQDFVQPFRKRMVQRGFWTMNGTEVIQSRALYVVLMRGVPLKIRSVRTPPAPEEKRDPVQSRDEASLDSELTVLGLRTPLDGFVPNPFYRRFTAAADASLPPGMLLVTRLDAPDDLIVRAMIQDSLLAEMRGLWGWAYLDLRGLANGPYKEGDDWINESARFMRRDGIPVITERTDAILPAGFPITQAAVYYGWYAWNASGAFAGDAQFQPGAIAVHIHSFSAASLRTPGSGWAAPLLAQGAAVTAGNVYEPYLSTTLHLDTFQDRLMSGMNVADAAYMAIPVLSWMSVVVGDPLYRPYLNRNESSPSEIWARYRDVVLQTQGDVVLAGLALKRLAEVARSSIPLESLANAERDAGDAPAALRSFELARKLAAPDSPERLRITLEQAWLLRATGNPPAALALAAQAAAEEKSPVGRQLLQQLTQSMLPPPPPSPSP